MGFAGGGCVSAEVGGGFQETARAEEVGGGGVFGAGDAAGCEEGVGGGDGWGMSMTGNGVLR